MHLFSTFDAKDRQVHALNGSGRSPAKLTLDLVKEQGFSRSLPSDHAHTITVPGACAAWWDLSERYGSIDFSTLLQPAVKLAEEGFPVAPLTSYLWKNGENQLYLSSGGKELLINGRAPRAGEIFRNPTLANTLKHIAKGGKTSFYQGKIAAQIFKTVQAFGGVMTKKDLADHHSTWEEPISIPYQGLRVYQCPPNGQGLTALIALRILSQFDLKKFGSPLSSKRLHYVIEALRLAFADTRWYIADPAFSPVPVEELLSESYIQKRAIKINPRKAMTNLRRGKPVSTSDTVYFSVVDGEGNACSFVNSNYMGFGTGIVPEGLGFSLQNRGHNFSLNRSHPNALGPGKRPYHTIIPALATRESDGSLFASFGVMGGFMQPQGHVQVLSALLDQEGDPQAALDQPRFCIQGGRPGASLGIEEGIPDRILHQLERMGHPVERIQGNRRTLFGRGQIILRDSTTGVLSGGSDPRGDGCAMGY